MHATSLPVPISTLSSQHFTLHSSLLTFFVPSVRSQPIIFFKYLCTDGARSSFATPGSAPLHPGLSTFNPFGVGFAQSEHSGQKIFVRRCMQRLYRSLSQLSALNFSLFTLHFSLFTLHFFCSLRPIPTNYLFSMFVHGRC